MASTAIVAGIAGSLLIELQSVSANYSNNARDAVLADAQHRHTAHELLILLLVGGVLLAIDSFVYCSVLLGILKRLAQLKAVSDRLALADIKGLSIDISGNDEIGDIGESLRGVEAAIEELLAVHA